MNRLFLVDSPSDPPKPRPQRQTPIDPKEIARETLAIVNQCAQALHAYHTETETRLGEICGLLDALELLAVRTLAKGGAR